MEQNFRRTLYGKKGSFDSSECSYFEIKEQVKQLDQKLNASVDAINTIESEAELIASEINELDKRYRLSGGVSYEEWDEKNKQLKSEETFREEKNAYLKRMANEQIPFIILRKQLNALATQLEAEQEKAQFELLKQSLRNLLPGIMERVYRRLEWMDDDEITAYVLEEFDIQMKEKNINSVEYILNLSSKDVANLLKFIDTTVDFDKESIITAEKEIESSLEKTQEIRQELEKCTIDGIEEYISERQALLIRKESLTAKLEEETAKCNCFGTKEE